LGVAYYRAGKWRDAVKALNRSVELRSGGDSGDWFFLAMAHWRLGDKIEARRWRDRALEAVQKDLSFEPLSRLREEAESVLGRPCEDGAQGKG
jgi:uncharacterized protein HemY